MKTDCRTCVYGAECFERELIGENDNCETYKPQPTMNVMAMPNTRAYVLKKEDVEAAKHLVIGIEDGWIDGSTDEAMEKYQEAKDALSQYDLIKTIKSDAYKEFAAKMYENIERNEGLYPGQEMPKMWASFAVEETLDELEGKL